MRISICRSNPELDLATGLGGCGLDLAGEPGRELGDLGAQSGDVILLRLQCRFALLPLLRQRLLTLGILALEQALILVVLVLRLLTLQCLSVLVVLGLALALFLECLLLLAPVALGLTSLGLPCGAGLGDLGLEGVLVAAMILDQLIERGGDDIDLVQPLELAAFDRDCFANGGELLDLRGQFFRDLG